MEKENGKAKSLIIKMLADSNLSYITRKETTKEMWKALVHTFERKSLASQIFLCMKLIMMKPSSHQDIVTHFAVFEEASSQLRMAGRKIEESDAIIHCRIREDPFT